MMTVPRVLIVPNTNPTMLELHEFYLFQFKGIRIEFKPGFRWDGASIPEIATALPGIGSHYESRYLLGSMVHDFLYSKEGAKYIKGRLKCDSIFIDILKDQGVGGFERHWIRQGVFLGGWASFRKA